MPYTLLLELGIFIIKKYIESTESKKDDKILDLLKETAIYLAPKANNTVELETAKTVANNKMRSTQRGR